MPEKIVTAERVGVFEFKARFTLAVVIVIFCSLAIAAFAFLPAYRELLTFSSAIVGGGAAIYAAYFAALTLRINLKRDMVKSALNITQQIDSIELTKVRTFVQEEIANGKLAPDDIFNEVTKNKEIHDAVRIALNHLEGVSISIQKGDSDEETVYMKLNWIVRTFYDSLKPYIAGRRATNAPNACVELQKLATSWTSGKFLSTGKLLPELGKMG